MLKKFFITLACITGLLGLGGAIWFFTYAMPRHYNADDFSVSLESLHSAASQLSVSGKRGSLDEQGWPMVFHDIGAEDVRVYPSGVLVKLHGVFTVESGLYFPSVKAEENLLAKGALTGGPDPVYIKLMPGVFSYKVAG